MLDIVLDTLIDCLKLLPFLYNQSEYIALFCRFCTTNNHSINLFRSLRIIFLSFLEI